MLNLSLVMGITDPRKLCSHTDLKSSLLQHFHQLSFKRSCNFVLSLTSCWIQFVLSALSTSRRLVFEKWDHPHLSCTRSTALGDTGRPTHSSEIFLQLEGGQPPDCSKMLLLCRGRGSLTCLFVHVLVEESGTCVPTPVTKMSVNSNSMKMTDGPVTPPFPSFRSGLG